MRGAGAARIRTHYRAQCGIGLRRRGLRARVLPAPAVINILNMAAAASTTAPTEAREAASGESRCATPHATPHFYFGDFLFFSRTFLLLAQFHGSSELQFSFQTRVFVETFFNFPTWYLVVIKLVGHLIRVTSTVGTFNLLLRLELRVLAARVAGLAALITQFRVTFVISGRGVQSASVPTLSPISCLVNTIPTMSAKLFGV